MMYHQWFTNEQLPVSSNQIRGKSFTFFSVCFQILGVLLGVIFFYLNGVSEGILESFFNLGLCLYLDVSFPFFNIITAFI